MPVNSIEERVAEQLALHHKDVVLLVYKHLIKKHNDPHCSCNYCIKLRHYVRMKIDTHRFKKRTEDDYYYNDNSFQVESLRYRRKYVKDLKLEKDELRKIIC